MSLSDDLLNDDVSAYQVAMRSSSGAYDTSANWQSGLLNLGTNFVNGLMQVELFKRAREAQAPTITSNQAPIYMGNNATTRAVNTVASKSIGDVLPYLLVAGIAFAVLRGR
jgi:hypothetical protein